MNNNKATSLHHLSCARQPHKSPTCQSFTNKLTKTQKTYFLGFFPTGRLSSAFGYAQAIDSTWETYQEKSGNRFSSRTSFSDSVDFIGWYATETNRNLKLRKSDVYNQYLAYHQGHAGFKRGTYKQKPNLIKAAKRTENNAVKYNSQLKNCL